MTFRQRLDYWAGWLMFLAIIAWCIGTATQNIQREKRQRDRDRMSAEIMDGVNAVYGSEYKLTPQERATLQRIATEASK